MADLTHPSVTEEPEVIRKTVHIYDNAYEAAKGAHALVVCTEWDEFMVIIKTFTVLIVLFLKL